METTIKATNLTKSFGDFTAVDKLNFEVEKGEIFGFLGANGAGKTTAMKMLIGISKPSAGDAVVAGYQVSNQAELVKKNIGYMSQKFALYDDLNIKENIQFFGGIYGLDSKSIEVKYNRVVENLGLQDYAKQLVRSLPLGWKQKLAFSVALLHQPKIVFLDEPTGGVDPVTRRQFWELIYEAANQGTTIFVTTHYMDEAEYCDRISIMVEGEIKALDTPKVLKKEFGVSSLNDVFLKLAR
ncbi:ABC transporter ATP-binding protein [Psychroflexus lacisalsi]|jgi:ABC-2 type transport system ATP-binding protein|uniref:ABC transporter domain-containing protein n=1 Tax=Psychroflexus lacisalsi TaxID=503928 RepID=A0ABN1KDJ5_9FLAO|nr:ABC transporter ATP-binding protein [Psychroflexus lacisalsi]MBZ9620174.1 ABC transporter ATP-binding protein [Psychroflexus lacisalsi]